MSTLGETSVRPDDVSTSIRRSCVPSGTASHVNIQGGVVREPSTFSPAKNRTLRTASPAGVVTVAFIATFAPGTNDVPSPGSLNRAEIATACDVVRVDNPVSSARRAYT